jgi:hypothetical protein
MGKATPMTISEGGDGNGNDKDNDYNQQQLHKHNNSHYMLIQYQIMLWHVATQRHANPWNIGMIFMD